MNRKRLVLTLALAGLTSLSHGATRTWDGEADTLYTNGVNWVGNIAPANADYTDNILFCENSPSNKTPYLSVSRSINTVIFSNSVGWTFSGAQLVFRQITSSGTGTNTFAANVKNAQYSTPISVATNSVLFLAGGFYQDGSVTNKLEGGGTLRVGSQIDGWSAARRLRIANGTLLVESNAPYKTSGAVFIAGQTARVQLKTTKAIAATRIGTSVIDETGSGLRAVDIGGGYAQIEVIPPYAGTCLSIR